MSALASPAWLHAAVLLFWGLVIGQHEVGVVAALLRGAAGGGRLRLDLGERELCRAADLTALVIIALLLGLLATRGLPRGLLLATGWLPVLLLPLVVVASCNAQPLRVRHVAFTLRHSKDAAAQSAIDLTSIYLAVTLLAASVLAKPEPLFLVGAALICAIWLGGRLDGRPGGRRQWAGFLIAMLLAAGTAVPASQSLHQTHMALQTWVIDTLAGGHSESDPYQRQTRIGDIGRLKLSERILWRLDYPPPVSLPLRLRQGVFNRHDHGLWLARRDSFAAQVDDVASSGATLHLSGETREGRSLLPVPLDARAVAGPGRIERNPFGITRVAEAPPQITMSIRRMADRTLSAAPEPADLALAPRDATLFKRLPELAALTGRPARERIAGLEAWFGEHFRYTLDLTERGTARDLERFLLHDRAGHCEYFATSTVLLLRALGVPARYVSGYSVQEFSRLEKRFLIRERHAHAWVEAYVDGHWIEIDTTPGVWVAMEEDAAPVWRPLVDLASFALHRFTGWRADGGGALPLLILMVVATGALMAYLWHRRQPVTRRAASGEPAADALPSAVVSAFRALETEFAQLGLPRAAAETPRVWLQRLTREGGSVVASDRLTAAADIVEALYRERYRNIGIAPVLI